MAIAWYLLDADMGKEGLQGACFHCLDAMEEEEHMPFPECFVPQDGAADGACTNCVYLYGGHECTHYDGEPATLQWTVCG